MLPCDHLKSSKGRGLSVSCLYLEGTGDREGILLGMCAHGMGIHSKDHLPGCLSTHMHIIYYVNVSLTSGGKCKGNTQKGIEVACNGGSHHENTSNSYHSDN